LQQSLYVSVESVTESFQSTKGDDNFSVQARLVSSLPILGSSTSCAKIKKEFFCTAKIDSNISAPVYQKIINNKTERINTWWLKIGKIESDTVRQHELKQLTSLLNETNRLKLVLNILNPRMALVNSNVTLDEVNLAISVVKNDATRDFPVTIRSNVKNDKVYINGKFYGSTRLDIQLSKGSYLISIEKNDYQTFQTTFIVSNKKQNVVKAILIETESLLKDIVKATPEMINQVEESVSKGTNIVSDWLSTLFKWLMIIVGSILILFIYLVISGKMKKIVHWMNE
jgi:hypothetical protein